MFLQRLQRYLWIWLLMGSREDGVRRRSGLLSCSKSWTKSQNTGLDGIELDIESERDGLTDQDRSAYAAFVVALVRELHSQGKIITPQFISGTLVWTELYLVERLGGDGGRYPKHGLFRCG